MAIVLAMKSQIRSHLDRHHLRLLEEAQVAVSARGPSGKHQVKHVAPSRSSSRTAL